VGHVAPHLVVAARCACRRCHTDAARLRRANGRNSVVRLPVGPSHHLGEPAGCSQSSIDRSIRRNAAVARSTRRLVAAGDHSTRHPVAAGE
jgi:hypothetical protein